MPVLDSYLFFDGTCAPAMRFYERTLGAKMEAMMTYAESPDPAQCPAGAEGRIMHASMLVGDRRLMASDMPPGQSNPAMSGFALSLSYPAAQEAKKVFAALAEGGQVMMPLAKTFWVESFGMLTDQFGTPWMISGGEQYK